MSRGDVTVRRAVEQDRADMLRITSTVWEGNDYVPHIWDTWMGESAGYTQAASLDGHVVGVQHVARRAENTAWIEGIRVSEGVRGRGVGEALLADALDWARRMGLTRVALATSDENSAARRLAEKAGLHLVASFRSAAAEAAVASADLPPVHVRSPADLDEVWDFIRATVPRHGDRYFYTEGWTVHELTRSRLSALLAAFAVCTVGATDVTGLALVTASPDRPNLRLGLLAGEQRDLEGLCLWLRDKAVEVGGGSIRVTADSSPAAVAALERAGFYSLWGNEMLLYERNPTVAWPAALNQ